MAATLALTPPAQSGDDPPNWVATATGQSWPEEWPLRVVHVDAFAGTSSHLGRFTSTGYRVLDPVTFAFVGETRYFDSIR